MGCSWFSPWSRVCMATISCLFLAIFRACSKSLSRKSEMTKAVQRFLMALFKVTQCFGNICFTCSGWWCSSSRIIRRIWYVLFEEEWIFRPYCEENNFYFVVVGMAEKIILRANSVIFLFCTYLLVPKRLGCTYIGRSITVIRAVFFEDFYVWHDWNAP